MSERVYPCEFCDTDRKQEQKLVTIVRQRENRLFIFEDVPALVCPNCGHRYMGADMLVEMEERMKSTPADARPIEAWAISLSDKAG